MSVFSVGREVQIGFAIPHKLGKLLIHPDALLIELFERSPQRSKQKSYLQPSDLQVGKFFKSSIEVPAGSEKRLSGYLPPAGLYIQCLWNLLCGWQFNPEAAALSELRFNAYLPAHALDSFSHDR